MDTPGLALIYTNVPNGIRNYNELYIHKVRITIKPRSMQTTSKDMGLSYCAWIRD